MITLYLIILMSSQLCMKTPTKYSYNIFVMFSIDPVKTFKSNNLEGFKLYCQPPFLFHIPLNSSKALAKALCTLCFLLKLH